MNTKLILTFTKFSRKFKPFPRSTLGVMRADAEGYNIAGAFVKVPGGLGSKGWNWGIDVERFALGFLNLKDYKNIKHVQDKIDALTSWLEENTEPNEQPQKKSRTKNVIVRRYSNAKQDQTITSVREAVLRSLDIRVTVNGKEIQL